MRSRKRSSLPATAGSTRVPLIKKVGVPETPFSRPRDWSKLILVLIVERRTSAEKRSVSRPSSAAYPAKIASRSCALAPDQMR